MSMHPLCYYSSAFKASFVQKGNKDMAGLLFSCVLMVSV